MNGVTGKVAFITGGSSGLGLGIAQAFAAAGMKVVIGYRTEANLHHARAHLAEDLHAIAVDVTDREAMERAAAETVRRFGKVHVLVSNAGVNVHVPLSKATYDDWDWLLNVNLTGVFNGLRAFLPHIAAHGEGGHLIATSSILGLVASGALGVYTTTKFGVVGMMEALRAELADTNIGVSVICPGFVTSNLWDTQRNRPSELAHSGAEVPPPTGEQLAEALQAAEAVCMTPLELGRLVLRGMLDNDLYILTHPEFERSLRERCEALMASIPWDVDAPEQRVLAEQAFLGNPIYAAERARRTRSQRAASASDESDP